MGEKNLEGRYSGFEQAYAEVNGVRLHYVTMGQGKLIMFVHGFPEFWAEWENQLVEFGKDYQVPLPDTYVMQPDTVDIRVAALKFFHV